MCLSETSGPHPGTRWLSGGVPDRNPGLADSRRSEQRQQSSVITFDEFGHPAEFCVSADRMISEDRKQWDRWFMEIG